MRDGLVEPDAASLDALHQQVLYLTRLLEDLRLLAETESGSFRLSLALASLGDVIRKTVQVFQPKADTAGVIVGLTIPDELPSVTLDDTRIRQVVGNLMDKAIRHTPSGGRITVSVALVQSSSIRVIVADTGDGIPTEAQPHVFERLYRVDPSRDRTTGGAGLGLTTARQLVEAHGGSIRVDSTPGEGSSFTVDLPR